MAQLDGLLDQVATIRALSEESQAKRDEAGRATEALIKSASRALVSADEIERLADLGQHLAQNVLYDIEGRLARCIGRRSGDVFAEDAEDAADLARVPA